MYGTTNVRASTTINVLISVPKATLATTEERDAQRTCTLPAWYVDPTDLTTVRTVPRVEIEGARSHLRVQVQKVVQ
jgi:hypothetical protein